MNDQLEETHQGIEKQLRQEVDMAGMIYLNQSIYLFCIAALTTSHDGLSCLLFCELNLFVSFINVSLCFGVLAP